MVRLDQGDYELVKRAADVSGMSMGGLLAEYVEMSRPMLQHMVGLADAMEQAVRDRREIHLEAVEGAMSKGQALADVAAGQLSMVLEGIEAATGAVNGTNILLPRDEKAEHGAGSVVGLTPVPTNRGVKTPNTPLNTIKKQKENKRGTVK